MLKSYYPHTLFDYDHYLFLKVSQYKILNLWLSITHILLSKIHALKGMLLTCNIRKHPQCGYKGNYELKENEKSILIIVYNAFTFKRKIKIKKIKNDIKLMGSQVVMYVINGVVLNKNPTILVQIDWMCSLIWPKTWLDLF